MRASVTIITAAVALAALPAATQAQTRTTTRGAFGGAMSADTTAGASRGILPQGATVGAARGAVSTDTTIGLVRNGPPVAVGGYATPGTQGMPLSVLTPGGFMRVGVIPFRGAVSSPGAVGAFGGSSTPETVLGPAGSQELEGRLKSIATQHLWDGNYKEAETLLNRSIAIREEAAGGTVRPEVASALEDNAKILREWKRDDAATDMEARAKDIRAKLEPPVSKRSDKAAVVGRAVLAEQF